jgi:hypothetical protein
LASIQPNPAHDEIVAGFRESFHGNSELIDETGRTRIMNSWNPLLPVTENYLMHELPMGLYLLRINGSGYSLRKMMIE